MDGGRSSHKRVTPRFRAPSALWRQGAFRLVSFWKMAIGLVFEKSWHSESGGFFQDIVKPISWKKVSPLAIFQKLYY
jgi:hypothetical protein